MSPSFPTDESVFDMYAAHLFLSGMNPYNPSLMANAFSYYNFHFQAFDPITPLTTGGYVNTLTYPALSFLVFIPAVIFKLKASLIMLPILITPIIIVWYRAWSRKEWLRSTYVILPFLSLLLYTYQGASADTDALWGSLLMLSYIMLPRSKSSGAFFGLALSVKQFPALIAPFFLYFVYREYGSKMALKWGGFGVAFFLLLNGYFIIQNPIEWLNSMIANEFAPLIGIGFGFPQISFAGFVHLPGILFTIAMVDSLLAFLILYILKYNELKYVLFTFPIIIFLFNSRLFPQYLYYWMLISLLPMIDFMVSKKPNTSSVKSFHATYNHKFAKIGSRILVSILALVIVGSVGFVYHEAVHDSPGTFNITSVNYADYNTTGFVDRMNITISYYGSENSTHVLFRVFPNGPIVNGNMYLWFSQGNISLNEGHTYSITIEPQYKDYSVNPQMGFMIVAYYGNVQGSYYCHG